MRFVVAAGLEVIGVYGRLTTAQDPTTAEASGLGLCVRVVATGSSSNRTNTMLTAGRQRLCPCSKRTPHSAHSNEQHHMTTNSEGFTNAHNNQHTATKLDLCLELALAVFTRRFISCSISRWVYGSVGSIGSGIYCSGVYCRILASSVAAAVSFCTSLPSTISNAEVVVLRSRRVFSVRMASIYAAAGCPEHAAVQKRAV